MPINVARLRRWLAAAAIILLAVVAGTYFYGRWQTYRGIREVPQKLGIDVKQSTEGFQLSKSEGGRTIFVVRASKAIQYQMGGRAELRDVLILVYGRQADRFDQIYGEKFEYDPETGNVSAMGEVHIDLEGNAEGPISPDQTQPVELKNPIHLQTSGLVFNQHTGVARTEEEIEFRTGQASGSARGAVYNSGEATVTLQSDVQFHAAGSTPADIHAQRATITREPYRAVLEGVKMDRPGGQMSSDRLTLFFRDNNTVERLLATGNVQASGTEGGNLSARAPRAEASVSMQGEVQSAVLSGGVAFEMAGASNVQGSAGSMVLNLRDGGIQNIVAKNTVRLVQAPANQRNPRRAELSAPEVTLDLMAGKLSRATTAGTAEVVFSEPDAMGKTVATAGQLGAGFDESGRIRHVSGTGGTRIVATRPGQPDRISTGNTAEVELTAGGEIATLVQSGEFRYREGPGLANTSSSQAGSSQAGSSQQGSLQAGSEERTASAEQARFEAGQDRLLLTGSPRLEQGGIATTAQRLVLARRSGQVVAEGDVKTTYSMLKQQPGGAMLAAADPVHVTAATMTATQQGGVAVYRGAAGSGSQSSSGSMQGLARLWQGANAIQAPVIEFHSGDRTVMARPGESSQREQRVVTVLVQQDGNGKVTPVRISARNLSYVDAQRRIRFEGDVEIRAQDMQMEAKQVEAFLRVSGQGPTAKAASPGAPSEIDRIVASGGVAVRQGERRAEGDTLTYIADNQRFVLKGQPASILDAERGQIRADSLTFHSRNDTVQVEGGSSPSKTQTRVAK